MDAKMDADAKTHAKTDAKMDADAKTFCSIQIFVQFGRAIVGVD
jgi:hypothetical protein